MAVTRQETTTSSAIFWAFLVTERRPVPQSTFQRAYPGVDVTHIEFTFPQASHLAVRSIVTGTTFITLQSCPVAPTVALAIFTTGLRNTTGTTSRGAVFVFITGHLVTFLPNPVVDACTAAILCTSAIYASLATRYVTVRPVFPTYAVLTARSCPVRKTRTSAKESAALAIHTATTAGFVTLNPPHTLRTFVTMLQCPVFFALTGPIGRITEVILTPLAAMFDAKRTISAGCTLLAFRACVAGFART